MLQALSGLAARTGQADGPPTAVGSVVVDQHAASLYSTAILAALYAKAKTGKGRLVEVNLYQAAINLQIESLTAWLNGAPSPTSRGPAGLAAWFSPGPYGIHATADGHMAISMASPKALAAAMDLPQLAAMSDSDSFSRREEITRAVAAKLLTKANAAWLPLLEAGKIWHAPVQDYADLQSDPQLTHLGAFQTLPGRFGQPITLVMHPARYDGEAPAVRLVPQALGAQSREVLSEAGYDAAAIDALVAAGVVGEPQ